MTDFFRKPIVKTLMLKGEKGEKGETGSVETLEIGGRNLLTGTNNGIDKWYVSNQSGNIIMSSKIFDDIGNVNGVRFDLSTAESGWGIVQFRDENVRKILSRSIGKKFSISFDIKSDVSVEYPLSISDNSSKNTMILFGRLKSIANEWTHVNMTGIVVNATVSFQYVHINIGNALGSAKYIDIANLKLERGEVGTDWTPSLEDYENKFNNIVARLEALEAK